MISIQDIPKLEEELRHLQHMRLAFGIVIIIGLVLRIIGKASKGANK